MEYKRNIETDQKLTYIEISKHDKPGYEAHIGLVTRSSLIADMQKAADQFMTQVPFVLKTIDPRTRKENHNNIELETYTAEKFYLYAIEGDPRFLKGYVDGELQELNEDQLRSMQFGIDLSTFLSYNELFTCFEESMGGTSRAHSLDVVLNTFAARMKLDAAQITGQSEQLSIHEVALLAGMKEKSVRNLAHKEIGAVFNPTTGTTQISSDNGIAWLKERRKFTQSQALQTEAARQKLVELYEEFF